MNRKKDMTGLGWTHSSAQRSTTAHDSMLLAPPAMKPAGVLPNCLRGCLAATHYLHPFAPPTTTLPTTLTAQLTSTTSWFTTAAPSTAAPSPNA